MHCDPDSRQALEDAGVVTRIGNEYELSKPARKILSTFTVAQGPRDSIDIGVDYPEVFVVMPFSQPCSDDVFSKMFKSGIEDAGLAGIRSVGEHRRSDGLLLMLSEFYCLTPLKPMAPLCRESFTNSSRQPSTKIYSATQWATQSSSSNQTISDHRSSGTCVVKRRARSAMRRYALRS